MKKVLFAALLFTANFIVAQKNVFQKKGVALKGYDVVAYFDGKASLGSEENSAQQNGVQYFFKNAENKARFLNAPAAFLPQYGGFCAYAMGVKGSKVSINPETFEIRDGKLYLFYNKGRTNTLELWLSEGAVQLKDKADTNWQKILNK